MKKFISTIAAAVLSLAAFAQKYTVDGVTYFANKDEYRQYVSAGSIDVDGGRMGVFSTTIEYIPADDSVFVYFYVSGKVVFLAEDLEGVFPKRVTFNDGSAVRVKGGSYDAWVGERGNLNTVILEIAGADCYRFFTQLRSKGIRKIDLEGGDSMYLDELGVSSASLFDNLCRLAEKEEILPASMTGKSPHHHWAIDREIIGPFKHQIGDTLVIDGHKGIVFEVSSCGAHGKVISVEKADSLVFYDGLHKNFGNTSYADGRANAKAIMSIRNWKKHFPALKWCASLGPSWYLPGCSEIIRASDVLHHLYEIESDALHSTYGYFSPLSLDIDFLDGPDKCIYCPSTVYAVAVF